MRKTKNVVCNGLCVMGLIMVAFLLISHLSSLISQVHAQTTVSLSNQYAFGNLLSLGAGVSYIVPAAVTFFMIGVTFILIVAGIKFIVSEGDKASVSAAKKTVTHTLIAVILFIILFLVVKYIPRFFNIGFQIIQ